MLVVRRACVKTTKVGSTALTILGTAGIPPRDMLSDALQQVMAHAARGELYIEIERVPLVGY